MWRLKTQNAAGATQNKAQDVAGATQQKANEAGSYAGDKWEQTKQASSDTGKAAQDKANQAKDGTGSVLQQVVNTFLHLLTYAMMYVICQPTATPHSNVPEGYKWLNILRFPALYRYFEIYQSVLCIIAA